MLSSYGSVFKAIHKESGQVVAIKQVPVESDLQEIIKEISIMQQCDRFRHNTVKLLFPLQKCDRLCYFSASFINSSTVQPFQMFVLACATSYGSSSVFALKKTVFTNHCVWYLFVAPML